MDEGEKMRNGILSDPRRIYGYRTIDRFQMSITEKPSHPLDVAEIKVEVDVSPDGKGTSLWVCCYGSNGLLSRVPFSAITHIIYIPDGVELSDIENVEAESKGGLDEFLREVMEE